MKGVDTNILIRFLTCDDREQAKKIYKIFKDAESEKNEFFVPLPVVMELIWVLESVYEISRTEILESISDLLLMPVLKFEHQTALQQFLCSAQENRCDLSDLLIAHAAEING